LSIFGLRRLNLSRTSLLPPTVNKSRNLLDKVGTLEKENKGLSHQLGEQKESMVKSQTEV
jgi:hypothetical protein